MKADSEAPIIVDVHFVLVSNLHRQALLKQLGLSSSPESVDWVQI